MSGKLNSMYIYICRGRGGRRWQEGRFQIYHSLDAELKLVDNNIMQFKLLDFESFVNNMIVVAVLIIKI